MCKYFNYVCQRNYIAVYIIYTFVIAVFYSPVVFNSFALTDDYSILEIGITQSGNILPWDIMSGRPLYGILQYFAQYNMVNIESFAWLRLFSIITTIFFCIILYHFILLRTELQQKWVVFFLPLFLAITPPFVVYNAWAACFPFTLSLCLSCCSYFALYNHEQQTSFFRCILSIILLVSAFLIYQPAGMVFLFFLALNNCFNSKKIKKSKLFISIITLFISMVISFIVFKFLPKILYNQTLNRAELTDNFIHKFSWFIKRPFINAISNYSIYSNTYYTIISLILFFIGLFFLYRSVRDLKKILLLIICIFAIFTPNLIIKESVPSFRIEIGLELILVTVIYYAIVNISQFLLKQKHLLIVLCGLFCIAFVHMQYCMYNRFVCFQQLEYQLLTDYILKNIAKDYIGKVKFDISRSQIGEDYLKKQKLRGEFSNVSLYTPWALKGMALSIKKTQGFRYLIDSDNMILQPQEVCNDKCIIIHTADILKDFFISK